MPRRVRARHCRVQDAFRECHVTQGVTLRPCLMTCLIERVTARCVPGTVTSLINAPTS